MWPEGKVTELWKYIEKRPAKENLRVYIFHLRIDFYRWQNIFLVWNSVYSDISELDLSDETIRITKISFQSEVMMKKSAEYYRKCYVAEKRIVSKP